MKAIGTNAKLINLGKEYKAYEEKVKGIEEKKSQAMQSMEEYDAEDAEQTARFNFGKNDIYKQFAEHLGFVTWGEIVALAKYGQQLEGKEDNSKVSLNERMLREEGNYRVRPGDTMSGIADKQGINLDNLKEKNTQVTDPDKIYVGENITVDNPDSLTNFERNSTLGIFTVLEALKVRDDNGNSTVERKYPGEEIKIIEIKTGTELDKEFKISGEQRVWGKLEEGGWVPLSYKNPDEGWNADRVDPEESPQQASVEHVDPGVSPQQASVEHVDPGASAQ